MMRMYFPITLGISISLERIPLEEVLNTLHVPHFLPHPAKEAAVQVLSGLFPA